MRTYLSHSPLTTMRLCSSFSAAAASCAGGIPDRDRTWTRSPSLGLLREREILPRERTNVNATGRSAFCAITRSGQSGCEVNSVCSRVLSSLFN